MTQKMKRETPKPAGKQRLARYGTEPFLLSVSAGLIPGSLLLDAEAVALARAYAHCGRAGGTTSEDKFDLREHC
jgi:hypothetical protein